MTATRSKGILIGGVVAMTVLALSHHASAAQKSSGARTGTQPKEAKKKFKIPVWHPDARWKLEKLDYAGRCIQYSPQLDGTRREAIFGSGRKDMTLRAGFNGNGEYVYMAYDPDRERFHRVTTGAAGYLDGPFARARFHFSDYHGGHERARSPDGRFFYFLAPRFGVRVLDFGEQMVSTLPGKGAAVACGESGRVYIPQGRRPVKSIVVLSPGPEWKVEKTVAVNGDVRLHGLGSAVLVDEKNGRLYATTYGGAKEGEKGFYIWYWDLNDGRFHGLLPIGYKKPNGRKLGQPGPFEGTAIYNHGEICWGPDDPEKNFIYIRRVDDGKLYRIDLKRRYMSVFSVKEGRFVDQGRGQMAAYSRAPFWLDDGSFLGGTPWYTPKPHHRYFKRVK